MSHHLYNPFASENKSSTQGQYGVHSRQAEIDPRMGSSRLGPGSSFSSPGTSSAIPDNSGGMFSSPMSQSMNYRPEQSRAIFDEKTERSSDVHMSRVRDEMRLPGQPIHRSIDEGTRFTGSQRDEFRSSGTGMASYQFSSTSASQGHRNSDTECSRSSLDWLLQRKRSTADDSMHYSSSEPDRQSIPGLGDYDHPVPDKHAAHTESSQPKYTTEAATNILLSLGFEKEDLEHLISYPDDQITPANLPFILRQIRIQKAKRTAIEGHSRPYPEPHPTRSVSGMDSHSVGTSGVAGMRQGETSSAVLQPRKVIDYGHVGKYTGMAGDEIGQTRDSRLNSSGSGSMQLMDSYNTSRLSREPLQRSPTEVKSSALGSSRQQTGSVPSSSSSYSSILKSVAPPSYDQTKRLPATPNQTSQTILSSFSLPKKDTDMRVFTSEASKPLPSKEPEADRQSTSKTQPLSTLFQHVLPRRPGSVLTGSNDNSDTKVQSKAPSQESRVAEQMKKQQMKKQQMQKQPVQQKQPVDRQSKQQKQQAQKQSVSQAGQALWPSVFPVSKSVPSTAVIPAITDTSRNTQHSTFIPGDLRGISTVPAKPQPIPSPIGLKHTTAPTSTRPPPAKVAVSKSLPTLAMMHDYAAASPRIFPHTCSLCNKECTQMKDWISHQNSSLHLESCTRLRKQYPDWDGAIAVVPRATGKNAKPPAATSAQTFQHRHQKVRHGSRSRSRSSSRSLSRSSSSSPHRHHGSDGRMGRRSMGSRSPQSSRYTRRSRSHSPWYDRPTSFHCRSRSRSSERRPSPRRRDDTWSSPKRSYERQSSPKGSHETRLSPRYDKRRSSPRRVEEPPRRFDERRSPQRRYDERQRQPRRVDERQSPSKRLDKRRSPPRRIEERCSSPKRIDRKKSAPKRSHESQSFPERSSDQSKKSNSAERLARRILEKTDVQTLSAQSDLEAMAKTLAPVILAELNKIKSSSSSSSSTTKKKLPAKRSKAKPSLQKRETDKASPPTMVKLDGIHDALSYNDVVTAAKQFGKTWSVVLSRSKQQAVVVYEKEEDAKKLKSLRSLDVNGVAVTVVTERVSDVQKKPPQKKPVTATTTSTATKKALLPTPNIPPLFPTPLLSGAMTAIPPLLSSSKPSPRPLHSAALKAVTIKPTSQEVAAKGSVKAPAAVTASKVLVSKAKNISSKQIAKTTEARKLPVKGAAKKAVAKKEMSSGSKSVAPKNQPDVGTSNVKKSKVVLKETTDNRGTTKKTNVEAQQRAKLGKANDAQDAAPKQLGETGVETAEPTQVEDCANGKRKKPTTTDAVPENSAEKPSKGLLTTSGVETLPTETKMTPNDPVTAVKTQSNETSAMDASTPTEPAAAAACEQRPAVTTASSAAVLPLTIGETQQHLPMEVESCADGKEGKPTTTDVVLEDSADGPSESQTTTSETLQTGADRLQEDSATPEKMQLDETSTMEASTPTEPAAAAVCEQQPAVNTASSTAVPPLTIAETQQQHLPMEVESCADDKEGKPTTTDVVLEDSADGPSESQTTTSETLQTGADRVQEDSAEKMQSDETSAMDASTPTEPAAAASTSSETAVTPLTTGETIEEHLHLDMIPSFNQRVLSQPNFYQLRGQQVLITGLPTYDDGCYTEEDVANLLMPFGFKYKCDKLYVVPQMCVAFVQMPTEVDESNIKSPNDQKPLFLKGSKLSFHLLSCDFEMTPSGLYKSLMDLVKSPVVERGPRTVFIDNIAPGDAGVLNKTLKEMYSLSNYLPLLNKVFIEFETVGDAERFENWYDGVKKDFGHKVLRLKIPSSSSASPIPQTAEENQTDGDSAKDEAVTPEPGAAAASEQEPAESTTSTASVMATTSTTTVPDEYLSFDEMIEKYLNPNAIECIDRENNNDQKLLLITGLPAYYDGSYKEDNISKLLIPLGFQHRYDNIYIVPQSRLAFVKMPTVEAVNKIMDIKGKTGIAFKGSTIRFHVVSNMNAETPGNFYDSVMKLMKLPGVDDMNKIVVVSNISQSEFVTLREALKDVYSVRRYLPLLNKVFIQFDTVSEVDEFDAWFCGVKHAYGHEVHMEKKSQQQPAASTPSTPSTPSTSSTPSTATVTPLTIGEMVEKHLDPLKIKCFDDMDRKALTQDNKLLLITGLPEFSDGCYTEDNITKLLIPLGFKHQYDNIYIVPECRLAFVKMPSAKILRNLMEVKGKNGIFFKGSKICFQVVYNFSAETPLDFYKSLMKLMKTPVIGDGRNIVIINNMSPGDTKDLRGALKNFGAIRNYLPLLNKVFIEFVSIHDPDRFAPWYNLHKKALKSSVYRMRIQSRTSTSQNPVDPAVTSQTDATDKPQTDVAVKTESDAAVKTESDAAVKTESDAAVTSQTDAAVTSQTDAAVTSQTDAAVKTKTDEAATSQMDAPVTSWTDAAVTLQIDAAATSQTDAAVTSPATSQMDVAATSQTDAAATSQTDAAATSQTDAAATSQTDAAATSQTDAAATSQKDAAVTSQTDAAVTSQTESAPAVISSTVWDMSEKLLDPKKIPCLKHMSLSSLKSLHRVPLLITGLPEFYDGCYTEADVAKLFIPFGYNYSPKSCPNIFVVPQSRWALVQMSRDTASTMHLATKKKQLVLKGCKLSVSLTVCGVKMLPLMIFQFLMKLMDVPLDEANGFKMVMVSNLPQVYVKDLRKALKKSGSVRSFLPLLNKVFIEFESLDDVGHFETWFRSFKTGSGPQVIRLKRVVSDKDSSDRTKPAAAAASTSATSGKMGEKHKPHDRIVSFNSENYTPTKADSVSSHITITRHFDEQNFNEDASPEPRSSSSSSRERTGRRSSGVSSAGKQILNVRKSSSSSKLSHKTSSSSGQKTNSRVKTSFATSSGRNTRSSSAGREKENIKSASSLELSIETHLRKLREEAEAGGASLKVQKEWSEDDFDECTEEVDGEIYQILDSLDDQTDEPMESENQDGSVENQTSGSEEYETFYEEDFQVLDCIDDDGKAYSEEDSEMEMDCSFQVLDSVTEDLPVSELDNSDDKDGEMKEDHYQGKCGQSDKGDRMKKTQEEASKDVEQPEDHPLQDNQDKHDDETETFEILDSVGDQTATEEGDQKLETPSKQICEDVNATEEQEEAFQIVDSVEDQPTATENKSDPDNKGRRSKRGLATSRKDGGPSRRSGRPTTASKTEEKEKTPKKQDRTTRAMDSSTKVSNNDEVVSEEMVYEVVDSVGDEPVEDSATTESSRRRSAGRSREDENTSNLTESTYSVEDKTANDELTNTTRSTRGRRARTSMKDAVNEKMKKEGMPTRRSRTPARESQEQRQKTPKKEEKPSPKESTATKTSVVREVSEDGAAFTILDSVEDKVEDDQPAAGLTEGRETPKKDDETTEKGNETLKKAEKDESEKVAEEGEATYEVLDSVEDKTIDGQHPAVLSESSGKEDISSKDDEQTQGEVMEGASKTDVKNENSSAPKPRSDAEALEVENKQESCKKNDTPSTLENLDEVSDEEEDYPDDTAAEEKLGMKRAATKEKIIAKEQETRRTRAREDRRTKEREERERMERRTKEREEREDRKIREREERERMDWRTKEREERWREDRKSRRTRERDEREREDRRSRRTRERDEREQRSRSSSRGGGGGGSSGLTVKDKDEETVEVDPSELVTLDELEADEVMSDEGIREEDLLALVTLDEYIEEEEEEEVGQAEQSALDTGLLLQESESVTFVTLDGVDGSDVEKKPDGEQAEETSGSAKSKHDDDTVNVVVGEEEEKKEEEKEEVTTRTRSQAKKRTRQTPAVRKPRGATAGPEAKRSRS